MAEPARAALHTLAELRFSSGDLRRLLDRTQASRPLQQELMAIVGPLSADALGDVAPLDTLLPSVSLGLRHLLLDWCLEAVDQRLQALYGAYLRTSPEASHAARLAALEAVRGEAFELVDRFDWVWLAEWLGLRRIGGDADTCLDRLSNFAHECWRVNFRFTYHCNIACRHCYNNSGPDAKALRLQIAEMLQVISEMPAAGIWAMNITGGEPFMYIDDVLALIRAGRSAGLREISVYTNGFWATTEERADEVLARLAGAGFMDGRADHLKVSAGAYHREFLGLDRVVNLARAFHTRFRRRLPVDYELAAGDADHQSIRQVFSASGVEPFIKLIFRSVSSLGRARDLVGLPLASAHAPCALIDQISIDPDGSTRPCCGKNNENDGIRIGSIGRDSLRTIVKRMQNDPILQFVATRPMREIFQHVGVPVRAEGYTGNCEACQHALGRLDDRASVESALTAGQKFYPFWFARSAR